MMQKNVQSIRILFLADSHLGLDLPTSPRTSRRRRGHDFLANHASALAPELVRDVDLVVHGGDVFDRPRVDAGLAWQAYRPLLRAAELGVPVFIVPGNHERSRLPHSRFLSHRLIHVFDRPRTFTAVVRGRRVVLAGFPYERRNVRSRFVDLLEQTGWQADANALHLLCIHHCVEGATVGPSDFVFTNAPDVIRGRDIPREFAAVLSGHVHRRQVLSRDLSSTPLPAPVLYPGSIERTSTAEIGEPKGFMIVELEPDTAQVRWDVRSLPARPMIVRTIPAGDAAGIELEEALRLLVSSAPHNAVLVIRIEGELSRAQLRAISSANVRSFTPPDMNVQIRADYLARFRGPRAAEVPVTTSEDSATVLRLEL